MANPIEPMYRAGKKVRHARTATVRAVAGEERVLDFILSTESRDRYNTEVTGWVLKNYRANPAITWAHCYSIPLIGNALRAGVDEQKRLVIRGEFTPPEINEFGYGIFQSYAEGWMRTYSAGFVPESVEYVDDDAAPKDAAKRGFWRLKKNDLLEAACVPVPANAECTTLALMQRGVFSRNFEPVIAAAPADFDATNDEQFAELTRALTALRDWNGGDMKAAQARAKEFFSKRGCEVVDAWTYSENTCRNCGADDESKHLLDCPDARTERGVEREKEAARQREHLNVPSLRESEASILAAMGTLVSTTIESTLVKLGIVGTNTAMRGAIPHKKQKLCPQDEKFNAATEAAAASVDDLWEMSAWFKGEGEKKGDFKLIHHKQSGYATSFRGVGASMVALNGGRGGVTVPANEKSRVYRHLVLHYGEFDAEAPELKAYEPKPDGKTGLWRDCTPEEFFKLIDDAERVSRGEKFMRNELMFVRGAQGSECVLAKCTFRSGELDLAPETICTVEDVVPEDFAGVFAFAMNHATAEQRTSLTNSLVNMQLRSMDLGTDEVAARFVEALCVSISATSEKRTPAPAAVEAVTMLRKAREDKGMSLTDVAARSPLTVDDLEWLDALTPDGLAGEAACAHLLTRAVAACGVLGLDVAEVSAAVARDVEATKKAAPGSESRTAIENAMVLLARALGDKPASGAPPKEETRSEDEGDGADDDGSPIVDAYLGSGAVDAAKRLRERAQERQQATKTGSEQHQPTQPLDLGALAKALQMPAAE